MKRITIYRNKDCVRCGRIARVHQFFDWFGRIDVSTDETKPGPLRPGEIAVEDHRTGEMLRGVDAVRLVFRQIPAYLPLRLPLRLPVVARRVDREVRGCADGGCAVPGAADDRRQVRS